MSTKCWENSHYQMARLQMTIKSQNASTKSSSHNLPYAFRAKGLCIQKKGSEKADCNFLKLNTKEKLNSALSSNFNFKFWANGIAYSNQHYTIIFKTLKRWRE